MSSTICGFSFGKNIIQNNSVVCEAIQSVLPMVDRLVFVDGDSTDGTQELVASLDPKVQVIPSQWPQIGSHGAAFCAEAQKALDAAIETGCTWGLYVHGEEVYHEDDLDKLKSASNYWQKEPHVKALLMRVLNFVHDYRSIDPWMTRKVCRMYKLDGSVEIFGDGCGAGLKGCTGAHNPYLDKHYLGGIVQWAGSPIGGPPVRIFNYGWVQTPAAMEQRINLFENHYWGHLNQEQRKIESARKYKRLMTKYNALRNFNGEHPKVMTDHVGQFEPIKHYRNRWLSSRFYQECMQHGVKL